METVMEQEQAGTPETQEQSAPDTKPEVQPQTQSDAPKTDSFVFDESKYADKNFTPEQLEVVKAQAQQIWHKENFIQKQSSEVGQARKKELELMQKEAQLQETLQRLNQQETEVRDNFHDNPANYDKFVFEKSQTQQTLQQIQVQKQAIFNEQTIRSRVPEIDSLIQKEVPEILKEDLRMRGMPDYQIDSIISEIKSGKWVNEDPVTVMMIADRAKARREIAQAKEQVKQMMASPDTVGQQISKVANQRPQAPASVLGGKKTLTDQDIHKMSDADIKKALAEARARLKA